MGDRSRGAQRVGRNKAGWELAVWSPWTHCWIPERRVKMSRYSEVARKVMKIPLGLDIVPVNGWQARLNRQGRDLIIEEEKTIRKFFTWTRTQARQKAFMPHMVE